MTGLRISANYCKNAVIVTALKDEELIVEMIAQMLQRVMFLKYMYIFYKLALQLALIKTLPNIFIEKNIRKRALLASIGSNIQIASG